MRIYFNIFNKRKQNFFYSPFLFSSVVCDRTDIVYSAELIECSKEDMECVGYVDKGKEVPNLVFSNLLLLDVCFPYGIESSVKRSGGRVVYYKLSDIREEGIAKDVSKRKHKPV